MFKRPTDYSYELSTIVSEQLADPYKANQKYLEERGNSKILEVTGMVAKNSEDFKGQTLILLKTDKDKAGINSTFERITIVDQ